MSRADLQSPDGLFLDAEQRGDAGQREDEHPEEDVDGQVGGAEVRSESGKQEGDESGEPLKNRTSFEALDLNYT